MTQFSAKSERIKKSSKIPSKKKLAKFFDKKKIDFFFFLKDVVFEDCINRAFLCKSDALKSCKLTNLPNKLNTVSYTHLTLPTKA